MRYCNIFMAYSLNFFIFLYLEDHKKIINEMNIIKVILISERLNRVVMKLKEKTVN